MNKMVQVLTKITYGLGLAFLLTGMFLTAMNVPVQAQEETPTSPQVVQTDEPGTGGSPQDGSQNTQSGQVAATEVPAEELAVTQEPPVLELTLTCVNLAEDGSKTALLSDQSVLAVVNGLVEGTNIVVADDAPLCQAQTEILDSASCSLTGSSSNLTCAEASVNFNFSDSGVNYTAKLYKQGTASPIYSVSGNTSTDGIGNNKTGGASYPNPGLGFFKWVVDWNRSGVSGSFDKGWSENDQRDCWDRSSLSFTAGCTGDCSQITATVCNTGDRDMSGPSTWELYYNSSGSPKPANGGTQVATGVIPALPHGIGSSGAHCAVITLAPSNGNGSYMFRALQRPGHPGQGELWSGQCNITCTLPTPTLTVTAERCALNNDGTGYQYSYTVNYSNFTSGDKFYYPPATVIGTADADGIGSFTFSAASGSVTVTTDRGASQSATASQAQLCPLPSIDVSVKSCLADLEGLPLQYTFSVSYTNLLVGTTISTTPDSGAHAVTSTSGGFDFTGAAKDASAAWSQDASVNDSATASDDLQCSRPTLAVTSDRCALNQLKTAYVFNYSVSFSGFVIGDEIGYPGGTYTTTATSGSFTFSSELDSVSVSSPYGNAAGNGATGLCPGPSIDISGICSANQDGTGYEFSYTVKYYNLLAGTSISYPGGTHLVESDGETTDDSFTFTSSESSAEAIWSKINTIKDSVDVDKQTCPLLDLQVSAESCALNQNGGGTHYLWTVYNPGIFDIDFTWTADPFSAGSGIGSVLAGGTTTFMTNKPTTSVTVVWGGLLLLSTADVSEESVVEVEGRSVTAFPSDELDCPSDVRSLFLLAPACSLDASESWQMTWVVENPNPWEVEFSFAVNGGGMQGPFILPASVSAGFVNTPLGENTVAIFWNGGEATSSATHNLGLSNCEGVPYDPPSVVDQPFIPVPVTGSSVPTLAAPAAGGEILIPVTGVDLSATQAKVLDFWKKLSLNLGVFFLGAALVISGVRKKLMP